MAEFGRAWRWMWVVLLLGGLLAGGRALAESNGACGEPPSPSHYTAQTGDSEDGQHFSASRTFSGGGSLELNVCSGEVHVRPSPDGSLHLQVTAQQTSQGKMSSYVKDLDVTADHAEISLEFPRRLHVAVTLEVPAAETLRSEVNLGAGTLYFAGDGLHGDRKLNVGAGTVMLYLEGDHGYASLNANVGMGSFHDDRPGGTSSHFIIARHYAGSGQGTIEMNVGAGSIHIEPRHEETI